MTDECINYTLRDCFMLMFFFDKGLKTLLSDADITSSSLEESSGNVEGVVK